MKTLNSGIVMLLLAAVLFVLPASSALAQWIVDGLALCTVRSNQERPTITSDGAGDAIITWRDYRSGSGDIYAQRVDASGVVQWTINGVALCRANNSQYDPKIVSDGEGGAIVTWQDYRSGILDIYAQRVNASGAVLWTTNGVAVCTAPGIQQLPEISSDGAGGAIITWYDERDPNWDIYAQRVDASGAVQWTTDGVALCTAAWNQTYPKIAPDGAGGAIVVWDHGIPNNDIYAQRVDASGVVQWTADGVGVCTATASQQYPNIAPDGAGGAIVTWVDDRWGDMDVVAQRIDASGAIQWSADGVPLCIVTGFQWESTITPDGAGGAIVTWQDQRGGRYDIYAQHVDASGAVQWGTNGLPLCSATGHQYRPTIVSDDAGGAIVTWHDERNGRQDIYAQRVDASGTVQWATDGVPLCTAPWYQRYPTITSDGAGGAIVSWQDYRNGNSWDIYAQSVTHHGHVGLPPVLEATIDLDPNTLNSKSSGKSATCYIELLEGYEPADIDVSTVTLNNAIPADLSPTTVGDYDMDGIADRMVKFNRSALIALLAGTEAPSLWLAERLDEAWPIKHGSEFEVVVGGQLADGTPFAGTDVTRAINPGGDGDGSSTDGSTVLLSVYPTAVQRSPKISYRIAGNGPFSLCIFDAAGRIVRTLETGNRAAGAYTLTWDRRADNGSEVRPGLYFIRLEQGGNESVKKFLVLE